MKNIQMNFRITEENRKLLENAAIKKSAEIGKIVTAAELLREIVERECLKIVSG
jgi:uncharacterized protein (DUF1778 family)